MPRPVRAFFITGTGQGGWLVGTTLPGDRSLMVVELRGKKTGDASRLDLAIAHIVFSPRSTFDLVRSGQRSNFHEKLHFLDLHAHSGVSMCRSDLKPSPACSPFNSEQDIECCYCISLQYLTYVVLLSRTASPSPAVIAVTVKIQIDRMTMIGQGVGEEVVWRRF